MANYKVVDADQLDVDLTSVADAIREKTGGSEALSFPDGMVAQLKMIPDLIVNSASGNPITLSDSSNMRLLGLNLYGKTTQDGTPTPEAPVELVSAGTGGSITVSVGISEEDATPQTLTCMTPNGLPGIPVTSGGNYTDETGQQWVCDEVDFGRGVYVQRIKSVLIDGSTGMGKSGAGDHFFFYQFNDGFVIDGEDVTRIGGYCSHYNHVATLHAPSLSNYEYQLSISAAPFNAMRFRDDRFTALDEVKANLAMNPMTLQYILATPTETPLSAEELAAYAVLHTNYPNTTILNDGGAGMSVSYVADTKNYIDDKISAMAAAIVNA